MHKAISVSLLFLLCPFLSGSQVFPAEGSVLNYRIIGFTFPSAKDATDYRLEIASGTQTTEESFNKNLIQSAESKTNRLIAEVASFDSKYTWRSVNIKNNTVLSRGELHHFGTGVFNHIDSPETRLRIEKKTDKYEDAFVFLNTNAALYDMEGHPVWYMPHTNELVFAYQSVRDLKITNKGTITFVTAGRDAYEIDYNGRVLWKAPNNGAVSGDSSERYNHELTRLGNGNYMILGTEIAWSQGDPRPRPSVNGAPPQPMPVRLQNPNQQGPRHANHRQPYGTVIEYDSKGKVVWSWKSSSYFPGSDIEYFPNQLYQPMNDVHQNSFHFDEKNKCIFLSYKNIHQVLKVKYPEGNVLKTYGEIYTPGKQTSGTGTFCFQHSIKSSRKGYLYLFNNNSCHPECAPEILVLQEPISEREGLKVVWNFEFPVPPLTTLLQARKATDPAITRSPQKPRGTGVETTGGNVIELPDQSMFASLCSPYSNVYIVSKEKKILWSAVAEKWSREHKEWYPVFQYRASIIPGRSDLEQLIWHNETNSNN